MLAQSFQSAADLGISEPQRDALCKTLVLLETGKLWHVSKPDENQNEDWKPFFSNMFNMAHWSTPHAQCGTVCCIGGTAELIGGVSFGAWSFSKNMPLIDLFAPPVDSFRWATITPTQAAAALRSYLTTGDARWDLVVA